LSARLLEAVSKRKQAIDTGLLGDNSSCSNTAELDPRSAADDAESLEEDGYDSELEAKEAELENEFEKRCK
jgi:hypothetical protein